MSEVQPIPHEVLKYLSDPVYGDEPLWFRNDTSITTQDLAVYCLALMDALNTYLIDPDIHGHKDLDDVARRLLGKTND